MRFASFILSAIVSLGIAAQTPAYLDKSLSPEQRAADLVGRMTLDEKISLLSGYNDFYFHPCERLGVPAFQMADGPLGVSSWGLFGRATAYPSAISLAASWNRDLAAELGEAFAEDWRARGIHLMLAPGMNLYRSSKSGRNFEYFGEDPWLTSEMAMAFANSVQKGGVMPVIKHLVGNDQEFDRYTISTELAEQPLRELYALPFERLITEGGAKAIMSGYNLLNGTHCSENQYLDSLMRTAWGFDGIHMSDWGATHSTLAAARAGLDMEMGSNDYFIPDSIKPLLTSGQLTVADIDEKARHIYTACIASGFLDRDQRIDSLPLFSPKRNKAALRGACEGIILLKNDNATLPFKCDEIKRIAVIGPGASPSIVTDRRFNNKHINYGGGGSSKVNPWYVRTPLDGIMAAYPDAEITYAEGISQDSIRTDFSEAARVAAAADGVVLCIGFDGAIELEGDDRPFTLPAGQDSLVNTILDANPRTAVVIFGGGGVDMSRWADRAPAIIHALYPGQEGGTALGLIVSGDVNPSAKLPFSIERVWEDSPACGLYDETRDEGKIYYREGLFMGYRGYDREGHAKPLFPFGHGLSYTTFDYSGLKVMRSGDGLDVTFVVTNTGTRKGSEIAQVYIEPCDSSRPVKELKGFAKLELAPGESRRVTINIPATALRQFDTTTHDWKPLPVAAVMAGPSSAVLPLKAEL